MSDEPGTFTPTECQFCYHNFEKHLMERCPDCDMEYCPDCIENHECDFNDLPETARKMVTNVLGWLMSDKREREGARE